MHMRLSTCLIILFLILAQLSGKSLQAAEPIIAESQVKAALLYNLAKFVEWPHGTFEQESRPMTMCTIGQSDFTAAISSLTGKQIKVTPLRRGKYLCRGIAKDVIFWSSATWAGACCSHFSTKLGTRRC